MLEKGRNEKSKAHWRTSETSQRIQGDNEGDQIGEQFVYCLIE